MKPIAIAIIIFAVVMPAAADEKKANELIQAAQAKETVQGDLKTAIELYGQAVKEAGANRALAVKSLLRVAECYQKMGDSEARKIYEQVVRDYADQREAVAEARAKIGDGQPLHSGHMSVRQVWSPRATADIQGPISPDGRYVPYADWTDHGNLYVHDFVLDTNRRLTDTANDGLPGPKVWQAADGDAVFSRDAKQLVYSYGRGDRYELRSIDMKGDGIPPSRLLYDNPDIRWISPQDWSPDGKSIAVKLKRADRTGQIGVFSIADRKLRILKSIDWRGTGQVYFSPDGKYVGYDLPQSDTSSERDVFVSSVDGTREIRAVAHPSNDLMMGWSPDGKWLLFLSDRSGSTDLWGQTIADGKPEGAPERLRVNVPVAPKFNPMGVTRSGALYFGLEGGQDQTRIRVVDFDFATGKVSNVKDIVQDYRESNAVPQWSPDGRQLVYKSLRGPAERPTHEVAVIRSMETGQSRELRPKLAYFGPLMWSPDGRSFLALGGDLQGRNGIFQINVETGDASALLLDRPGERSWYPCWAPDGKSFYFKRDYRKTKDSAYIRVDLASGNEAELIRRRALAQTVLSPDGRYFASQGIDESTNSRTMLLIPANGGEPVELMRYPSGVPIQDLEAANKGAWISRGPWAPDSRSFLAYRPRGPVRGTGIESVAMEKVLRVPIDGSKPQKLELDSTLESFQPAMFVVSPDGKRVAVTHIETAPRRDPEVWALENFLPTPTAKK